MPPWSNSVHNRLLYLFRRRLEERLIVRSRDETRALQRAMLLAQAGKARSHGYGVSTRKLHDITEGR